MTNQKLNTIWIDPLKLAKKIANNYDQDWIFLYSGLSDEIKNSKSIIALDKRNQYFEEDLSEINNYLDDQNSYENSYFGYISYEYKDKLEEYPSTTKSFIDSQKISLINFSIIFEFDHDNQSLTIFHNDKNRVSEILNFDEKHQNEDEIKVTKLESNFSDEEYLKEIKNIKKEIENGTFYQTNLTRKFYGKLNISKPHQYFSLFEKLAKISPANYSSFLKFDDQYIISASPELFLKIEEEQIISQPIKGTSPRSENRNQDEENKDYLTKSDKEKAENLMIVDLVRNDISRVCEAGSVQVKDLFKVDTYKTLHHLSSKIIGKKNKEINEIFNAAFPPGSMTGAPKIKAIETSSQIEKLNRGIYSGSIGYFKNKEEALFNVVIRTLICQNDKFEFQVGGAITFDSKPKKELEEIYIKAKAILKILNL